MVQIGIINRDWSRPICLIHVGWTRPICLSNRSGRAKRDKVADERNADPRDRILRAASELFGRYGFQAVGVDRIVEESGVAKMTLYRAFTSKDDLIVEYLSLEDARIRHWLRCKTADVEDPKGKLRAFYEALEVLTADGSCTGCPFQMAASEFPDPHHPAHRLARTHKSRLRAELERWVCAAGLTDAESLANQLFVLMEGSWAAARLRIHAEPARDLAAGAVMLVEGALYAQAVSASTPAVRTKSDR